MKKLIIIAAIAFILLVIAFVVVRCRSVSSANNSADAIPLNLSMETSAAEIVEHIKIGWNLGNTLDPVNLFWLPENARLSQFESAWGNPVTTQAMIDAVKNAGFNALRIPVSWSKVVDDQYNIRADWMERVIQVVNYGVSNDMFIILNTHHDESIFKFMDAEMEESAKAFQRIWEQIAFTFRDYDIKLMFEGLNEPRTVGSSMEWNGGTPEEHRNLNIMNQLFVDTVRAGGGNNEKRVLLVPTYAASATSAAMNALVIPNDPKNTNNKIIVSIHAYEPYNFALNENSPVNTWSNVNASDTWPIIERVNRMYDMYVSRGIPVILGELGALNKNNEDARAQWAEYYISYAKSRGIKCFWWDDGGNFLLLNRRAGVFTYPQIVEALIRGAEQ